MTAQDGRGKYPPPEVDEGSTAGCYGGRGDGGGGGGERDISQRGLAQSAMKSVKQVTNGLTAGERVTHA